MQPSASWAIDSQPIQARRIIVKYYCHETCRAYGQQKDESCLLVVAKKGRKKAIMRMSLPIFLLELQ